MAGLMTGAPAPQPAMQDDGAMSAEEQAGAGARLGGDGTVDASPEEQAQYDKIINGSMQLIYSQQAFPAVLDRLRVDDNKPDAVADIVSHAIMKVEAAAASAGQQLSGDALYHAGIEMIEDLADTARKAGVADMSQDDVDSATILALDKYRMAKQEAGQTDQSGAQQDLSLLRQADQSGQLGQLLRPGPQRGAEG